MPTVLTTTEDWGLGRCLRLASWAAIALGNALLLPAFGSDLSKFLHSVFDDRYGRPPTGTEVHYYSSVSRTDGPLESLMRMVAADDYYYGPCQRNPDWTLDGDPARSGMTRCRLGVRQPNAFRLEVSPGADQRASLLCASDGKTTTRLYHSGRQAVFSRREGGLAQLLDDALTDSCLKGTGLNVLFRPAAHAYLMASVSSVKDCGREPLQGRPAEHFAADWFGGSRLDFWISADDAPVLLQWKRVQKVDLGGQSHELQLDSRLEWDLAAAFADDQTVVETPSGAVEARDLQTYLLKGGTDALLGQAAPTVAAKLFEGSDWDLSKHRDEHVVVLFFFATWAVPSRQDMPAVLAFIDEYADRGAAFYAIDVGEGREPVRAYIESLKYSRPVVLDPDQKIAEAYRITSLPVTVLIGKDGTLQAVHVGATPEARAAIRQDLSQLVEGKRLVEAGR